MRDIRSTPSTDPRPVAQLRGKRVAPARRALCASFAATLALLATACSLWQPAPVDETVRHVLDARPAVAMLAKRDLVLSVSPPRAAPGYDSTAMAYVQKPHALDHYATHRWADTPARMLGPLLTRTLEDTGSFRAVVQGPAGLPADLQLDTEIVHLRQSFLAKPSRVEFTLRMQLFDVSDRRVLATRYIEVVEEASSDDAAGGVVAANAAIARALAQVAAVCVDASAGLRPRTPLAR
jgi:cholesterol transport system auxiliary component